MQRANAVNNLVDPASPCNGRESTFYRKLLVRLLCCSAEFVGFRT